MDHLVAVDVLLGDQAALPILAGGSFSNLASNVFYFTSRVVDKLWQGMEWNEKLSWGFIKKVAIKSWWKLQFLCNCSVVLNFIMDLYFHVDILLFLNVNFEHFWIILFLIASDFVKWLFWVVTTLYLQNCCFISQFRNNLFDSTWSKHLTIACWTCLL